MVWFPKWLCAFPFIEINSTFVILHRRLDDVWVWASFGVNIGRVINETRNDWKRKKNEKQTKQCGGDRLSGILNHARINFFNEYLMIHIGRGWKQDNAVIVVTLQRVRCHRPRLTRVSFRSLCECALLTRWLNWINRHGGWTTSSLSVFLLVDFLSRRFRIVRHSRSCVGCESCRLCVCALLLFRPLSFDAKEDCTRAQIILNESLIKRLCVTSAHRSMHFFRGEK